MTLQVLLVAALAAYAMATSAPYRTSFPSHATDAAAKGLWPIPANFSCSGDNGHAAVAPIPLPALSISLKLKSTSTSNIAAAAMERYQPLLVAGATIAGK